MIHIASISYDLKNELQSTGALGGKNTKSVYLRAVDKFEDFMKTEHIRSIRVKDPATGKRVEASDEQKQEWLQKFEKSLEEKYSPATVHTYTAGVARALKINLGSIEKPSRISAHTTKGRLEALNPQGKKELETESRARIVGFEKAVGIRRDELRRLTGKNLVERGGSLFVEVEKGKGGKYQLQHVLPKDEALVREVFRGVRADEKVFSGKEINNKIDFHSMRRESAQEAYKYYCTLDPNVLKEALLQRFKESHDMRKIDNVERYKRFANELDCESTYKLRGDNRKHAIEAGLPTEYSRIPAMATACFKLSHWRLNVTVCHYLNW